METQETQETQTEKQTSTAQPDLTVNDLSNLRALIDIAVKRGAFNASEISGVGVVYDRLNNFLTNIANQQKSAEATK